MMTKGPASFVAGFVTAAVLFGGAAMATGIYQQNITVTYAPLTYRFDGMEKVPPQDQKGFIYNGRTYVPLRFMSEALGKEVQFDPDSYTISVGRQPSPLPALWEGAENKGEGTFTVQYFETGAQTIRGEQMERSALVSAMTLIPDDPEDLNPNATAQVTVPWGIPAGAKTLSGTLFVPDHYFGQQDKLKIGRLTILNEWNQPIYTTEEITSASGNVPFQVSVASFKQVRLVLSLYPAEGLQVTDSLLMTQVGVSNLKVQ